MFYFCDKCDKKYVSIDSLRDHIQVAHENIKFSCSLCQMSFSTRLGLKFHHVQFHSTDKRHECKVCGVRKGNESKLRRHELSHLGGQFQCSFCPKKLYDQDTLTAHERQHTGEKPFECSLCSASFTSKKGLGAHRRGAHKIEGPRGGKPGWKKK